MRKILTLIFVVTIVLSAPLGTSADAGHTVGINSISTSEEAN